MPASVPSNVAALAKPSAPGPPFVPADPPFVANWWLDRLRATTMFAMKDHTILAVTSLLSIVLLRLHAADDIVRGISKAEPANTALLVLAVLVNGTLVLAEQRSGHGGVTFILSARGLRSLLRRPCPR